MRRNGKRTMEEAFEQMDVHLKEKYTQQFKSFKKMNKLIKDCWAVKSKSQETRARKHRSTNPSVDYDSYKVIYDIPKADAR